MKKTKKIEIKISNEKLELLRKMGLTPEDVFFQGFESLLRRKYREVSIIDDEEEEDIEILELCDIPPKIQEINDLFINDNNLSNN